MQTVVGPPAAHKVVVMGVAIGGCSPTPKLEDALWQLQDCKKFDRLLCCAVAGNQPT